MKKLLIINILVITAGLANAATIISSGFDGNTGATIITGNADNISGSSSLTVFWTGDESGTGSALTAISPAAGFTISRSGQNVYSNNNVAFIGHNLNIFDKANPRGYSFKFTASATYDLISLTLLAGHTTRNGANDREYASDLSVTISGGVFTDTTNIDYSSGDTILIQNYDLTGNSLVAGTQYTVTVTSANLSGRGAYMVYDGITLEGDIAVVPEPSSIAFLGLGGLSLILRRCR